MSGITGAGPLFHAILEAAALSRPSPSLPVHRHRHPGLRRMTVCAFSGEPAGPDCPQPIEEWVPDDAPPEPSCTMHERVRVERSTGLRAGPGCSADQVDERVFERYPAELAAWAEAAGRPTAPRGSSPACPAPDLAASSEVGAVRIAYPPPGSRFVLDPDRPREAQILDVHVVALEPAREVALRVDGQVFARVGAPFEVRWPLAPGRHELEAEAGGARSAKVRIDVRATDEDADPLPGSQP